MPSRRPRVDDIWNRVEGHSFELLCPEYRGRQYNDISRRRLIHAYYCAPNDSDHDLTHSLQVHCCRFVLLSDWWGDIRY